MSKSLFVVMLLCLSNICNGYQSLDKFEIAGKIIDQDGTLITDEVVLTAELETVTYPDVVKSKFYDEIKSETKILEKKIYGGTFSWKLPDATFCDIKVEKDGYHGNAIVLADYKEPTDDKIIINDLTIHLIKKGSPSKLEYVHNAHIPDIEDKESKGKECGWSFIKLWYFPVVEEETVWLTRSYDEEGRAIYTMKEPGGFVCFPGYPMRESTLDKLFAKFEWMPQAPEDGYVQSVCPESTGGYCFYFKTPDGKYGKIALSGDFDYYIQPDGSRNLEAGEVDEVGPINPIEAEWEGWAR
ncbi:MAG: hypothetical protein WC317_03835 [Candidatus Omnitrophota bacterium]